MFPKIASRNGDLSADLARWGVVNDRYSKTIALDGMNFYRNCARKATNPDAKAFYNDLAEWEQGHYQAFKSQLDMLKEEYFIANNFVPF